MITDKRQTCLFLVEKIIQFCIWTWSRDNWFQTLQLFECFLGSLNFNLSWLEFSVERDLWRINFLCLIHIMCYDNFNYYWSDGDGIFSIFYDNYGFWDDFFLWNSFICGSLKLVKMGRKICGIFPIKNLLSIINLIKLLNDFRFALM